MANKKETYIVEIEYGGETRMEFITASSAQEAVDNIRTVYEICCPQQRIRNRVISVAKVIDGWR